MSTSQLVWTAGVFGFLLIAKRTAGWASAFAGAYLLSLCGIPIDLFSIGGTSNHIGVASSAPAISLGDVFLAAAVLAIWSTGVRLKVGWLLAVFLVPSLIFLLAVWGNTPEQWSGIKLYATALLAFGVGRWLSGTLSDESALVVVCACLIVCAVQFTVAFAQLQGATVIDVGSAGESWISAGRMVGIHSHPAILGRNIFLLFCFLLPLTAYPQRRIRTFAYCAIAIGVFAVLLTLSRANTVAIVSAIVLWVIFNRRADTLLAKISVIAFGGAAIAANSAVISELQDRQAADPSGGYRGRFREVALDRIQEEPLTGVGPNSYVQVVGQYDIYSATGFPVHNVFLYSIVETGLIVTAILFWPIFITLRAAFGQIIRGERPNSSSAALLSVLPGIFVIASTGWGLLTFYSLPLWFIGFGFLAATNEPSDPTKNKVKCSEQDAIDCRRQLDRNSESRRRSDV